MDLLCKRYFLVMQQHSCKFPLDFFTFTPQRCYRGNKKYLAWRSRKRHAKNVYTKMESLHAAKRGEKYNVRYTDKHRARSDRFVPASKLPAPRWNWDYDLVDENRDFLTKVAMDYNEALTKHNQRESPLRDEDWPLLPWEPGSIRCGAVGVKLGVHPLWLKDGTYRNCTLIQLLDCQVIKYWTKEEYNSKIAAAIVGCKNASPFYKNEKYTQFCLDAGVPVKTKCFRFLLTENAAIKPGTQLNVTHFRPGQFVDCTAQSVGYGFAGVIQRWHFAGGPSDSRGSHKFHRRPGSIGNRSGHVNKGKKLPGQLGGTYETTRGLKVLRLNTRYNVMYVQGRIAGHVNQFVKIQDTSLGQYKPKTAEEAEQMIGAFPKYLPSPGDRELPDEIYHSSVHPLHTPSIQLTS